MKAKKLTLRAAKKRIKELETVVARLRTEAYERKAAIIDALGLPSDIEDYAARIEELESRFW